MQTNSSKLNWLTFAGFVLALPAAYLIVISVLKYNLHVDGPFDASRPFLESAGIKEPLGWNINLLIAVGPVLAVLLSVFHVLKIEWHFSKEDFQFHIRVQKKWFPLLVIGFATFIMAILFFYLVGENCR